jgi:ABC-2 type transport system ATP-binding protein
MAAAIIVEDLRKSYGSVVALDGISFTVGAGEVFGLLGVNGAGKTTTLEILSGLREPDAGRVGIAGLDPARDPRAVRAKIGVVLPTVSVPELATPREALRLFATWRGDRRDPQELLERFGLGEQADGRVGRLSQGQRQRLNLALGVLGEPPVMLLDEPSNGLDPAARHQLQEEIAQMREAGRAVAQGTPAELATKIGRRQRVRIETAGHAGAWPEIEGVEDLVREEAAVSFATADAVKVLARLLPELARQGIEVRNLEVRPATLEESFLRLTQKPGEV